jgi:hypothetical protein
MKRGLVLFPMMTMMGGVGVVFVRVRCGWRGGTRRMLNEGEWSGVMVESKIVRRYPATGAGLDKSELSDF